MSAELVKNEETKPAPKTSKIRVEHAKLENVIECWRMLNQSRKPEEAPLNGERERMYLFSLMGQPNFFGLVARAGRKNVGQILGQVDVRNIGRSDIFFRIVTQWFDPAVPAAREELQKRLAEFMRRKGINRWEGDFDPDAAAKMTDGKVVAVRLAGQF